MPRVAEALLRVRSRVLGPAGRELQDALAGSLHFTCAKRFVEQAAASRSPGGGSRLRPVLLDARSPGEFCLGRVPGSVNVPVLDDEARKHVGTLYKTQGQGAAVELGFKLIEPSLPALLATAEARLASSGQDSLEIYCARGGLRSRLLASFLGEALGVQATVIEGGYKAIRRHLVAGFDDPAAGSSKVVVVGGQWHAT